MDLTAISLLFSILAFLVSILVFWDNRNKTEIMKNQLGLLQEQMESKKDVRDAIRAIGEVQKAIEAIDTDRYDWGDFGGTSYISILENLHDSGESAIKWKVFFVNVLEMFLLQKVSFEQFRRLFEDEVSKANKRLIVTFDSEPKIEASPEVEVNTIDLTGYFKDIYSVRMMQERLKGVEKVVNLYDSTLITGIGELYLKALKAFYVRMENGAELTISRKMKTAEIGDLLLTFVALDNWKLCVDELRGSVTQRLYDIERHLIESS